jgi:hypothetical protein
MILRGRWKGIHARNKFELTLRRLPNLTDFWPEIQSENQSATPSISPSQLLSRSQKSVD